ncbi:MAG: HPr family phosphocarrier protein [Gammaproteobacteria bacterium]|nr:MAG: HPr family phosphocarrier protein [Gammaproteobacteria bacterium]
MQSRTITIINKLGMHARAAARFVQTASRYNCDIHISKNGRTVNGKSIMGVMMLAAAKDSVVQISAAGKDELAAMEEIERLILNRFGEAE